MLKDFKDNLFLVFVIVGIAIAFLLGKSCSKNKENNILKPTIVTTTLYRDTIFPKDTIFTDKWHPSKPKHDTVWIPLDSIDCNKVVTYNDTIKRPEYNVYTKTTIQGVLRNMDVGVKLKIPLVIRDSVVIKRDSTIFYPSKYAFYIGLLASPKSVVPTMVFSKDKNSYIIGYDPFNKTPIIGYLHRLWGSKKQ